MRSQTKLGILAICVVGTAAAQSPPVTVFADLNTYTAATKETTLIGFNGILPAGTKFENINPLIVTGVVFSSSSFDVTTADYYAPRNYAADFLMSVASS